jgi:recombination protein RecA
MENAASAAVPSTAAAIAPWHHGPACDPAPVSPPPWSLENLAGRLCEITGARAPRLTLAASLVLQAQRAGQPAAWVGPHTSCFYPPDLAAAGVDLHALPVVRAPDALAMARAADHLLRSGAFGLVVLDLPPGSGLPLPAQTRLAGLARRHRAVLLCLGHGDAAPFTALGSLVSWRAEGEITRTEPGRFRATLAVTKDKRNGPGGRVEVMRRGPDGLR